MACSGGLDSLLLLCVLAEICAERLQVVYIDHQLQQESANWGKHIALYCQKFNLPFQIIAVHVADGNVEQQARIARYHAFQELLNVDDVLILAHHQQDQAETLLLRLLSGAGVQGLSAMRQYEQRADYKIWRPFLGYSRQQLKQWAEQIDLDFIQDPMNDDTHYDRVWCRKELWGILEQRFPHMQQAIARTSQLMQDAHEILYDVMQQDWAMCGNQYQLNIKLLQQLSTARQRQVLSAFMQGDAMYRPPFDMVERVQQEVIYARADAQAQLHYQNYYYVKYGQILYRYHQDEWLKFQHQPLEQQIIAQLGISYNLSTGVFNLQPIIHWGLSHQLLGRCLTIKSHSDSLKIRLHQRQGAKSFKKFCQEMNIPVWWRLSIQFLWVDDELLGIFTPNGFVLTQSNYVQQSGWLPILQAK